MAKSLGEIRAEQGLADIEEPPNNTGACVIEFTNRKSGQVWYGYARYTDWLVDKSIPSMDETPILDEAVKSPFLVMAHAEAIAMVQTRLDANVRYRILFPASQP